MPLSRHKVMMICKTLKRQAKAGRNAFDEYRKRMRQVFEELPGQSKQ